MTSWPGPVGAVTLFVEDLAVTNAFYGEVFGLPTLFEDDDSAVFGFGSTMVNLVRAAAAPELIAPAPVGDSKAGARFVLTLEVENVDATCEELQRRGVEVLNGPLDRPWGVRTASFQDPAGTIWEIAR